MNTLPHVTWLTQLEAQVEQHISLAIEVWQNADEAYLLQKPAPGSWSIAQCLWHLNSYGDFYLPRLEAAFGQNTHTPDGPFESTWLGSLFTRMMKPGKGRYKAFKDHRPPNLPDARQTVATFIQQQEQLLQLLRKAQGVNLNHIRVPISITSLIQLKAGDALQFLLMHQERHVQQALRAGKAVSPDVAHA